jgi:DNA-binding MltR family transcriptional regulator
MIKKEEIMKSYQEAFLIVVNELLNIANLVKEFEKESDRAVIIIGASRLDSILENMIKQRLVSNSSGNDELFNQEGPISTFSAKINMAYRLGLIDNDFANLLHIIRKLRNDCAHCSVSIDLNKGNVADRVREIIQILKITSMFSQNWPKSMSVSGELKIVFSIMCFELNVLSQFVVKVDSSSAVTFKNK